MPAAPLRWVNFELSSRCNLRCRWCNLDHSRPKRFFDPALLARGLDELAAFPDVEYVRLHSGGEPLLHPRIDDVLALLARKRRALPPRASVELVTNGTLARGALARKLAACKGIDAVLFSIDGGSPAEYERIRVGARWSRIADNFRGYVALARAARRRPRQTVGIVCLVSPPNWPRVSWMHEEFKALLELCDISRINWPHHWDGTQDVEGRLAEPARKKPGRPCCMLGSQLVVLADGQITVCCNDLNHRCDLGNFAAGTTLAGAWAGRTRQRMLADWARGRFEALEPCRTCEGMYEDEGASGKVYQRMRDLRSLLNPT